MEFYPSMNSVIFEGDCNPYPQGNYPKFCFHRILDNQNHLKIEENMAPRAKYRTVGTPTVRTLAEPVCRTNSLRAIF